MRDRMVFVHVYVVRPTLLAMGPPYEGPSAEAVMLAAGWTESEFDHVWQRGGPAVSWWQIEPRTCVDLCSRDPQMTLWIDRVCGPVIGRKIEADARYLAAHQRAACVFARRMMYVRSDPLPACAPEMIDKACVAYLRAWRPGRPIEAGGRFSAAWPLAVELARS